MHGNEETRLRVPLFGTLEVCRGDAVVVVPGARLRGSIARLALAGGRPVEPGVLVDALWPRELPTDPANALQSLVSRLRRVLGAAGAVTQSEGGYRLLELGSARRERTYGGRAGLGPARWRDVGVGCLGLRGHRGAPR